MDSFEWNKIIGAILGTLLFVMVIREAADYFFPDEPLEQQAFAVAVPDEDTAPAAVDEGPIDFGRLLREASVEAGERVARRCVACHTFEKNGPNRVGPNLWGVLGGSKAHLDNFNYSSAMAARGDETWTIQAMYDYLENPRAYVPGTSMAFAGLGRQADRINIIAYMREHADDPIALPDPLPAAEVDEEEAGETLEDLEEAIEEDED
jgi:cytochrome c